MKRSFLTLFAVMLLLVGSIPLAAQEQTGSIEGTVKDSSGAVLPGVTVEATGTGAGTVTSVTDSNGQYRFPRLPSGRYQVKASLMGYNTASATNIDLTLGKTATVNLTMNLATVSETITVTADAPVVDVTQSATNTSIAREQLEMIPKGRDFTSVVAQAAGASNEAFVGGISIDGASGSENRFVIDGVDTTHPQDGLSGQGMITDFVEEIQVKSAGYAAEFGGSVGGVINAVTKTGTNDFNGWVGAYLSDSSWEGDERPVAYGSDGTYRVFDKDDAQRLEPGIALGGPILRDRLWFFAGYSPTLISTNRTPSGSTREFSQDDTRTYFTGNVKGNIGSKFLFKAAANITPREVDGILPARDNTTPADANLDITTEFPTSSYSAYADFLPSTNFYVSGRVGQYNIDTTTSGVGTAPRIFFRDRDNSAFVPTTDPLYRPRSFSSVPAASHAETTQDEWERLSGSVDANYFLNAFGQHAFKAGVQMENIQNQVSSGEPSNLMTFRWGLPDRFGAGVIGTHGSLGVRRFRTEGAAESENLGFYLQDAWQVRPNLTLNLGVRTESEKVPNYGAKVDPTLPEWAIEFDYGDKIAPRLGFAWDVFSNQRMKVYGSYGDYYDITKIEMPRGSFGADKWIEYLWPVNTANWQALVNSANCTASSNNPSVNPCPGLGAPSVTLDLRHPTNPHDAIDPDLKPMQQREFQLGTDWQLSPMSVIGARYVNKTLINTIEDIGFLVETSPGVREEHYITGNPGKGLVAGDPAGPAPSQPEAIRDYEAIELTFNRLFSVWSLRAAYTYSKLEGNYSGLASSDEFGRTDPNVARYFDALHNAFDQNGDPVVGPLTTDRPHAFEVQGLYRAPWNTHIGVNFSWASGTPISEEVSYIGVPFFPHGRANQGRTPSVTTVDLLLTQPFEVRGYRIEASLNVLNLLDSDTATQIENNHYLSDLCDVYGDDCDHSQDFFFAQDRNIDQVMAGEDVDPFYLKPLAFQAPRAVRLGLKFIF